MIRFAASIMCANQLELKNELKRLEDAHIDMLHCDVMDGVFVNNLAMGPYVIERIKKFTKIPLDIHLATVEPEKYIKMFLPLKPEFISFHAETTKEYYKLVRLIKDEGIKASIAISPDTPIEVIKNILKDLDMVLMMTVNPGFSGQSFKPYVVEKIKRVKEICSNENINPLIEVDGSINEKTIPKVVEAGANVLVLGTSSLFNDNIVNYSNYIEKIKNSLQEVFI
ncbi:ribulose-phosphate 3-epimerase [Thermoanaerobacterium sp. R66]|uniref:ribulose-phosphate 3-epimerase n=1 Tax=Thermoanaerobacterium sp. R66 TaxID=2742479 RepID=UPI002380477B|nr:ribulose-phosphate 3-epimerase [Thermoanaerobacterium sp. R66]MDE4542161.1 ribulose-phosphate 3-epimerase [Thermoanaerobacterium sp. R66]